LVPPKDPPTQQCIDGSPKPPKHPPKPIEITPNPIKNPTQTHQKQGENERFWFGAFLQASSAGTFCRQILWPKSTIL